MSSENKKRKKELQEIKNNLLSSQDVLIQEGIKKTRKKGDHTLIHPLLTAFQNSEGKTKEDLREMLSSLKISAAENELVNALDSEEFDLIKADILSFIWNSGFQPLDHIHDITRIAVNGDYLCALEALTLIENLDGLFQEEFVLESTVEIRNYLNEKPDEDKKPLLVSLLQIIEKLPTE